MMRRSIVAKSILLMAVAGAAQAQPVTVKEFIENEVAADFYWPFENSFISDRQRGSSRIKPDAYEYNGLYATDCTTSGSFALDFAVAEYFPIFPDHMTRVGASSALSFGETEGDLVVGAAAPVERYLEFSDSNLGGVDSLEAFGMESKDNWTMHMIVSPDEDESVSPQWQTLFDNSDPDYTSGGVPKPIQILLKVRRNGSSSDTDFQLSITSQGNTQTKTIHVDDADVGPLNQRLWYQVIAQYYTDPGNGGAMRLYVNTVDSSGNLVSNNGYYVSNEWRNPVAEGVARIGLDHNDAYPYFGAIQHFAIWKGLLDTTYAETAQIEALGDAFKHSASVTDPDPRASEHVVDWDAPLRYYMWDVPLDADPIGVSRDLESWLDPIWDREGVYPMVRLRFEDYATGTPESIPSLSNSWSDPNPMDPVPDQIAEQTANWIQFISEGIEEFGRDVDGMKSMSDENASVLLWQNFGTFPSTPDCFYNDGRVIGKFSRDWRDAPSVWRNALSIPTLSDSSIEVGAPYYREGMSLAAFRSKDIFISLKKELVGRSLTDEIPNRFHFDSEAANNLNKAWVAPTAPDSNGWDDGWWDVALNDTRADDVAFWVPPTWAGSSLQTLADIGDPVTGAAPPNLSVHQFSRYNEDFTDAFATFTRDQYDHEFGMALLLPAIQELSDDIRLSEYAMVHAGSHSQSKSYLGYKPYKGNQFVSPVWFDYSAPVLYPLNTPKINSPYYFDGADRGLFAEWGERLGVNDLLETDDMPDFGEYKPAAHTLAEYRDAIAADARVLFVERAKYNLNANYLSGGGYNGAPIVPWLPYPRSTFSIAGMFDWDDSGGVDSSDVYVHDVEWQDVAKIAVFAYRHGVREFIFWGDWKYVIVDNSAQNDCVDGLENIFLAVENAERRSTDMTSAVSGNEGVPDGQVGYEDYDYFDNAYVNGDLEADYSGPDGYPDGVVNLTDETDYYADWLSQFGT